MLKGFKIFFDHWIFIFTFSVYFFLFSKINNFFCWLVLAKKMEVTVLDVCSKIRDFGNYQKAKEASDWLSDFERSQRAWEISCCLLNEIDPTFRFFGAKMLYSKLQRQFVQAESLQLVDPISNCLLQQLERIAKESSTDFKFARYISLSLSVIALQLNQPNAILHLMGILSRIVRDAPLVVLEFMIVLPEECDNRYLDISEEKKRAFCDQLGSSIEEVLNFLHAMWTSGGIDVKIKVFQALQNWMFFSPISPALLASKPIVALSLQCISEANELFEPSIQIWIDQITKFGDNKDLNDLLLPQIPSLLRLWEVHFSRIEDDLFSEEIIRSIAYFVSDFADHNIEHFLGNENFYQTYILQMMSQSTIVSNQKIATAPLEFFECLSQEISRKNIPINDMISGIFADLLQTTIKQMMIPSDEILQSTTNSCEALDNRKVWNYAVSDCAMVIGERRCRDIVSSILAQQFATIESANVSVIESCFYSCQMLCRNDIQPDDGVMHSLVSYALSTPLKSPIVGTTVLKTISSFDRWLSTNLDLLFQSMSLIFSCFTNPMIAEAASDAFRISAGILSPSLADKCGDFIAEYLRIVSSTKIDIEVQANIIEGLTLIINHVNSNQGLSLLQLLTNSIGQNLVALSGSTTSFDVSQAKNNFLLLKVIFSNLFVNENTIFDIFHSFIPISQQILVKFPNHHLSESIVGFYKHAIRKCPTRANVFVGPICSFIVEIFKVQPFPSLTYLASVLASDFGNQRECQTDVIVLVQSIASLFFERYPSLEHFKQDKYAVEEFFYFLARVARKIPIVLLSVPSFPSIIEVSIACICVENQSIQKSSMDFIEATIASSLRDQNYRTLMLRYNPIIVQSCFDLLSGKYKLFGFDESDGSVCDILLSMKHAFPSEIKV